MKKQDIQALWLFTLRIGMYTGEEKGGFILSFLRGYELGTYSQCKFIEILSNSIEEEYKIQAKSISPYRQIEILAQKLELDWVSAFKRQSLKVLNTQFDDKIREDFIISFKQRIISKLKILEFHFRKDWIGDWYGLCDLSASWFKGIWTEKAFILIKEIDTKLKNYGKIQDLPERMRPSQHLKELGKKLLLEIDEPKKESLEITQAYHNFKPIIETAIEDREIEIAKAMKRKGYLIQEIIELTGLSETQINTLKT